MKRGNPLNKNIMKNKNGNPVPSLTKEEIEYLNDNLLLNNTKSHIRDSILRKLNGVETNKEQPIGSEYPDW